jgi:predicted esterase YcpF (UPF0227 family)
MKTTILYIHGFNSGPGDKVDQLKTSFPTFNIISPQLTFNIFEDLRTLTSLIKDKDNLHIIGCSLGAFYALLLKEELNIINTRDVSLYLINPSLNPHITLKPYLNQTLINYKTRDKFKVTQKFLDTLEDYNFTALRFYYKPLSGLYFFIGMEDEVIDHKPLLINLFKMKVPLNIYICDQDHKFSNIEPIIKQINKNLVF